LDGTETTVALKVIALLCAVFSGVINVWFLVAHRGPDVSTRVLLFLGVGVLPLGVAFSGNVAGFEASKERSFCGSCHVMEPYVADAKDQSSESLASLHSRNPRFRKQSCYTCHSDYGMYGTLTTKTAGMQHLWRYYTVHRDTSLSQVLHGGLSLYQPFLNAKCQTCHSGELPGFKDEPEHAAVKAGLATGEVRCVGGGCHGPAHPFIERKAQP
jgi:cytochrome c-type protein NapC